MKKVEFFLLGLYAVTLGERFAMTAFSVLHFTLVSFLLANFYFIGSFILFNGLRLRDTFKNGGLKNIKSKELVMSILAGVSVGTLIVSLLFTLNKWPIQIEKAIMLIGALLSLVSICLSVIFYNKSNNPTYRRIIWRLVPAIIITLLIGVWF